MPNNDLNTRTFLKLLKAPLLLVILCLFFVATPQSAQAEVTSKPCPYSCKSLGLKKKNCKDWKEGNTCYVERTGKKKQVAQKGVTSKPCPYSCKTAGLKKKKCKDWRKGDTCFVQKL